MPSEDSPVLLPANAVPTSLLHSPPDSPTFSNFSKRKVDLLAELELDPPAKKFKQDQIDDPIQMVLEPPDLDSDVKNQIHHEIHTFQDGDQFNLKAPEPLPPFRKQFTTTKQEIVKTKKHQLLDIDHTEKRRQIKPPQREIPKTFKDISPKQVKRQPTPEQLAIVAQLQRRHLKEKTRSTKPVPPSRPLKPTMKINTAAVLESQGLVLDRSRPAIMKGDWHHEVFSSC